MNSYHNKEDFGVSAEWNILTRGLGKALVMALMVPSSNWLHMLAYGLILHAADLFAWGQRSYSFVLFYYFMSH